MSFKDEIEDYTGTISDTAALDAWLTHAARLIVHLMPDNKAEKFSKELTDGGSGISVEDYRPLWAHKDGYRAIKHPAAMRAQLTLATSIFNTVATSPAWYIELLKAYVVPSGGTVVVVPLPIVVNTMSSITNFPNEYKHGVVLYAAIQGIIQQLNTLSQTTLGGITFGSQTVPTTPTYTALPTFNPPVFGGSFTNIDSALTDEDVELADGHARQLQIHLENYTRDLDNTWKDFQEELSKRQEVMQEYSAEIGAYSQNIQQEIQRIGALVQQHSTQHNLMLAQLTSMKEEYKQILELVQRG